jgi:hypothetical protein
VLALDVGVAAHRLGQVGAPLDLVDFGLPGHGGVSTTGGWGV